MKKDIEVLYYQQQAGEERKFSHKYTEPWEKTELFCPRCGKHEVWFCNNGGDYYVGEKHICTACKGVFYLPDGVGDAHGEQDEQRVAHLTANAGNHAAPAGGRVD